MRRGSAWITWSVEPDTTSMHLHACGTCPASVAASPPIVSISSSVSARRGSIALAMSSNSARASASQPPPSIGTIRSEEHTSELQSLMRSSYAVFCLKKKTQHHRYLYLHSNHIVAPTL